MTDGKITENGETRLVRFQVIYHEEVGYINHNRFAEKRPLPVVPFIRSQVWQSFFNRKGLKNR